MALSGKGIYLWQIMRVAGGDPAAIAKKAAAANLTHVLIKVADGRYGYGFYNGKDMVSPVVAALRAKGIQPWGWQYIYGKEPLVEARKAIERARSLGLAGFVVNAEGQFKARGMDKVARAYMKELRKGISGIPVGLSTYRYPSVHYPFPFSAFLDYCDYNLPQIYWINSVNPAQQLQKSYNEYKNVKPWRTFVPTGAAFAQGNWSVTPAQINDFLAKARDIKLPGANFWEMGAAKENGGKLWQAIKGYDWATGTAPSPGNDPAPAPTPAPTPYTTPAIVSRYLAALNSRNTNAAISLYEKDAKLFAGNRRFIGGSKIKGFYSTLFKRVMRNARFSFRTWSWRGNVYKINWRASSDGKTWTGSDTILLNPSNPKLILEHYSAIPVKKSLIANDVITEEPEPGPIPV